MLLKSVSARSSMPVAAAVVVAPDLPAMAAETLKFSSDGYTVAMKRPTNSTAGNLPRADCSSSGTRCPST